MKAIFLLIISCFIVQIGNTQNLVPDEAMDFHDNVFTCPEPMNALLNANYWYNVGGTCDLYMKHCLPNNTARDEVRVYPAEGNNFIGFWGIFLDNNVMGSEVFGTTLTQPLQGGQAHFFSIDARYRGKWSSYEDIYTQYYPYYCFGNPAMALQIYLSEDTIQAGTNLGYHAAFEMEEKPLFTFDKYPFQDTFPSLEWTTLADCFIATGGETHLGFSMTIDTFTAEAPCDSSYKTIDGMISRVYYNVDNVKMIPMPKTITDTILLCKNLGTVDIDMKTYFPGMAMEYLDVEWQDGFDNYIRTVTVPGIYTYRMFYRCGYVDFEFLVEEKKCDVNAFVPNAFTPNFDGKNDELFAFFSTDFPISDYEFMVFDRWGNTLYRTTVNDGFTGWDGTMNGKTLNIGTYVWVLKYKHHAPEGTKDYQLSGDVLLIR